MSSKTTSTDDQMDSSKRPLSGWGGYPLVPSRVKATSSPRALRNAVEAAAKNSSQLTLRGLGRSYADQAIDAHATVLDLTPMDRYLSFDENSGLLRCEAGTSLETILNDFVPRGFLPMITPGTKFVTIGGCIANDVHGKAHHADGCFSECTESFRILLASGEVVEASREKNSELFWANFGGLGLLGIILDATIKLRRVETAYFRQRAIAAKNLDELLDAIDAHNDLPYSVAWIDSLADGPNLGRGVLTVGEAASSSDLKPGQDPLKVSRPSPLSVPFNLPTAALNRLTISTLNTIIEQVQKNAGAIAHYEKFFYPLDFVGQWHRGYGKRGFCQYQFVIPDGKRARENLRRLMELISTSDQKPFLNVLKRLGPEHPNTSLSFPVEGYTFAIDFPITDGLPALIDHLDDVLVSMGGRIYLGKDAFLKPKHLTAMYPKIDAWRAVKRHYDPEQRFTSHLARRVGL